jgi:hypothetical protein
MMLLRDVSLFLNRDEYGGKYSSDFQFRSRYLCNFVRRRIAPLKFKSDGFGSIVVEGCREPIDACPIRGEKVASATVAFDQQRYESNEPGECHEFFIGMLTEGLEKCARHHRIPLSEMKSAIDDFRAGGYRNEWTYKKKAFLSGALQAWLNCSLDMEKFVLTLKLEQKGVVVYDASILETKPDETIFAYRFKDVVLDGRTVVVKNKFDEPTFSLDLDSLPL